MPETFVIPLSGNLEEKLHVLKQRALQNGIILRGNTSSGSFEGDGISGSYVVSGNLLTVTIHNRPFFVPMSYLESEFRKFLSQP